MHVFTCTWAQMSNISRSESNSWHFTESHFTSVLNCEKTVHAQFIWYLQYYVKSLKNMQVFHSKSRKTGKITIYKVLVSQKWWNVKFFSHSIHTNFDHDSWLVPMYDTNILTCHEVTVVQNKWPWLTLTKRAMVKAHIVWKFFVFWAFE